MANRTGALLDTAPAWTLGWLISDPRLPRSSAWLVALLLAATYAYFLPGPSWNEVSRLNLVRALVERWRVDIDPYAGSTGDKAFRAGHYYSDKAPGASFAAVPAYAAYYAWLRAAGKAPPGWTRKPGNSDSSFVHPLVDVDATLRSAVYVCNLSTNVIAGAALGVAFLAVLLAVGVEPRLALAATGALSVGSLILPYATLFFGHVLAAAALFAAFALLSPFGAQPAASSWKRIIGSGTLAGFAVLTEFPAVLAVVALAAYLFARVSRGWRARALLLFAAGTAPGLALLATYNAVAFGSPFRTGYAFEAFPPFAWAMSFGFAGVDIPSISVLIAMLFGRSRGLFYVAPVLALGLLGLVRAFLRRELRLEAALCLVVVCAFFLFSAGYFMWWGGDAFGPRHVIPALPFLCFGLPFALPANRWGWSVFCGLAALSAINQVVGTTVSPLAPYEGDILLGYAYPHFLRGEVAMNLGLLTGLQGAWSLLPLIALWIVVLPLILAAFPPARQLSAPVSESR